MPSEARLKFLKKIIILGPKTAILGPQFCRILVLGPHFWWSGGGRPPGPPLDPPLKHISSLVLHYYSSVFRFTKKLFAFDPGHFLSNIIIQIILRLQSNLFRNCSNYLSHKNLHKFDDFDTIFVPAHISHIGSHLKTCTY